MIDDIETIDDEKSLREESRRLIAESIERQSLLAKQPNDQLRWSAECALASALRHLRDAIDVMGLLTERTDLPVIGNAHMSLADLAQDVARVRTVLAVCRGRL
jgi:hypothetical protein